MNTLSLFKPIKYFIFDVDGVLTDGSLLVESDGHLARTMHARDGYAMNRAVKQGYEIIIITGGKSLAVEKRLKGLGIEKVFSGVEDKLSLLRSIDVIDLVNTLYMGDDMPDYHVIQEVGLPTCPQDACPEIKDLCKYISPINGGKGCVRDVIEKVLKLNNHWL
jgi:3-deoxy-D-manno-octulosonate 8-phosphate phosphatase (KDO 8-P phosphatase)